MQTHYDEIGNLFGRIEGSELPEETVMSGSHHGSRRQLP